MMRCHYDPDAIASDPLMPFAIDRHRHAALCSPLLLISVPPLRLLFFRHIVLSLMTAANGR